MHYFLNITIEDTVSQTELLFWDLETVAQKKSYKIIAAIAVQYTEHTVW